MARVYLDSCVVIYLIQGPEGLSRTILKALRSPEGGPPISLISDLTRLECRVLPLRQGNHELLQQFDDFFASADLTKLPITTETFDLATELRAVHGVKTSDALHLAAAILGECQEFWTNDLRLTASAQNRIKVRAIS